MSINMLQMPWQHLRKTVFDMASGARAKKRDLHWSYHGVVAEIDNVGSSKAPNFQSKVDIRQVVQSM